MAETPKFDAKAALKKHIGDDPFKDNHFVGEGDKLGLHDDLKKAVGSFEESHYTHVNSKANGVSGHPLTELQLKAEKAAAESHAALEKAHAEGVKAHLDHLDAAHSKAKAEIPQSLEAGEYKQRVDALATELAEAKKPILAREKLIVDEATKIHTKTGIKGTLNDSKNLVGSAAKEAGGVGFWKGAKESVSTNWGKGGWTKARMAVGSIIGVAAIGHGISLIAKSGQIDEETKEKKGGLFFGVAEVGAGAAAAYFALTHGGKTAGIAK